MPKVKVEAYSCKQCSYMFLYYEEYREHLLDHKRKNKEDKLQETWNKRKDDLRYKINSLVDLEVELEKYADSLGYSLSFSRFPNKISKQYISHHRKPLGHVMNETGVREFSLALSGRCAGTFNYTSKSVPRPGWALPCDSPFDFVRYMASGYHTGGGSGGKEFSFDLTMFLADFPNLQKQYLEYKSLMPFSEEWNRRGKEIINNYEEEIIGRKLGDIKYCLYSKELERIRLDIENANKELKSTQQLLLERELEIRDEIGPYSEPDMDVEVRQRFLHLHQIFSDK